MEKNSLWEVFKNKGYLTILLMVLSSYFTLIWIDRSGMVVSKAAYLACEEAMSVVNKESRQCMYDLDRCQASSIACIRRWIK